MSAHEYHYLYNTSKWRKIRKNHMAHNPLCIMCEARGKIILATICDHIIPHKGNVDLFYSGPFQSLCKLHHDSTKQKSERRQINIGGDINGQPIDNRSHWYK
jgi:5-methylcytosine-specific restriction endonuclease McrA